MRRHLSGWPSDQGVKSVTSGADQLLTVGAFGKVDREVGRQAAVVQGLREDRCAGRHHER